MLVGREGRLRVLGGVKLGRIVVETVKKEGMKERKMTREKKTNINTMKKHLRLEYKVYIVSNNFQTAENTFSFTCLVGNGVDTVWQARHRTVITKTPISPQDTR